MQESFPIPILNGMYTNNRADYRVAYPSNLTPIVQKSGIANGYLRPSDGIVSLGSGPGIDRGGINWRGICYRVMGTKFIRINSDFSYDLIGDVGGADQVTMGYTFTYLGIVSNRSLFLFDGTVIQKVTDPDLGVVIDMLPIDGYFMTTDGESLIVTDLNDSFSVNPLKYGSSEQNPDPILALLSLRGEAYALNRNTIEVFTNVGGTGFPFQVVKGALIEKGTVGTHSCCIFMEQIAFVGSGDNENVAAYFGISGKTIKFSTREIDLTLASYSDDELQNIVCEVKVEKGLNQLWIRLPDQTLVYDGLASQIVGEPIWFILTSGLEGYSKYRALNLVLVNGKWIVGDPDSNQFGYLTDEISSHWGDTIGWEFSTLIVYNKSKGVIFNQLELVGLNGRSVFGANPSLWTQYSLDGKTFSNPSFIFAGKIGERNKRMVWLKQGSMRLQRIQKFRGNSDTFVSFSSLMADLEPLNA